MEFLKPYKVVFTRIGDQESWAGWRIAGYTEGTPSDVLAQCSKIQAKNADNAKFMYAKCHSDNIEEAKKVFEFICDFEGQEGKAVSFTRQTFGDSDSGGRTNMIASSVCFPVTDYEELIHHPQKLLSIDRNCFDECQLNTELLSRAAGKANYGLSEVQTIFEPKEYSCKNDFDILKAIEDVFKDKKIYQDFIKCIYWNLTFKSSSSIFIKSENTLEDNIKIFLIAINSIVYSYRTKLGFRTFDFEDPTNQPTIVFSKTIPYGVRFFDVKTGENNILTESVINKLRRQFMEYYPQNVDNKNAEKFFDLLDKTLVEFGSKNATEVQILETAFAMMQEEIEGNVNQSDKEIIKKIITFCNLPYSNDKIDSYIANLLDSVIVGDISLNDDIKNHIDKKLRSTKCSELIDIGNQYRARNLLREEKTLAFKRLFKIKSEDINYNKILEYILLEPSGKVFIDEFYGKCYGPQTVSNMNELIQFDREVQSVLFREQIDVFIKDRCFKYGEEIVNRFFDTKQSLVDEMNQYEKCLSQIYSINNVTVSAIVKRTGYIFWAKFEFNLFSMNSISSYQKMHFSDMRSFPIQTSKCGLVNKLVEIFKTAEKQNDTTVRAFKNKIEESSLLDEKSQKYLIQQFRKYCLDKCDKRHHIDFWLALGDLDVNSRFNYFFDNRIRILTSPDRFDRYIEDSKQLSSISYLVRYRDGLDAYRKQNDSRDVVEIFDIVKQYELEIRKALKSERKREKKHLEHAQPKNKRSQSTSKETSDAISEDVDFVTGNSEKKRESNKSSGGKFPFSFLKRK